MHTSAWSSKELPMNGKSASSARELDKCEDIQGDSKLEDWFGGGGDEEWGDVCEYVRVEKWVGPQF